MRILLVEDDEDLRDGIGLALEKLGYQVDQASDGEAADHLLRVQPYDLVILDIGLPRLSGLEVLRRLRHRKSTIAVLALTARDGIEDRVAGLDAGADDYLVKPFVMDELMARIRALLRRGSGNTAILVNGPLQVDTANSVATVAGAALALTRRELVLAEILVRKLGKVITKTELVQRFSDWDNELGSNAIEVAMFRLRRKLEPHGISIRTVRGAGYVMDEADGHSLD